MSAAVELVHDDEFDSIDSDLVLAVDDDRAFCTVLEHGLAREDARVRVFADSNAALDVVRRQRVAVVVADLRMSPTDGVELLRRAQEIRPCTVGIILTAYDDFSDEEVRAQADGTALRTLHKPVDMGDLRRILEEAEEVHRDRVEALAACGDCAFFQLEGCAQCAVSPAVAAAVVRLDEAVAGLRKQRYPR